MRPPRCWMVPRPERSSCGRHARRWSKNSSYGRSLPPGSARRWTPPPAASPSRKVVGRAGEEYFLLDIDDVLAFQAEREIVWIVTARQRYMATQPLHRIDARLKGSVFQRVHRNALVNVNHVRKMTALSSQRWLLTLSNGQEFIVSKRQAGGVRQMLQW